MEALRRNACGIAAQRQSRRRPFRQPELSGARFRAVRPHLRLQGHGRRSAPWRLGDARVRAGRLFAGADGRGGGREGRRGRAARAQRQLAQAVGRGAEGTRVRLHRLPAPAHGRRRLVHPAGRRTTVRARITASTRAPPGSTNGWCSRTCRALVARDGRRSAWPRAPGRFLRLRRAARRSAGALRARPGWSGAYSYYNQYRYNPNNEPDLHVPVDVHA